MKKIIGLTLAAIMVMTLVGVGTLAYFSDTETSTGNIITAGTLDLVPSESGTVVAGATYAQNPVLANGVDGLVSFSDVIPGGSGNFEWDLHNTGTIGGTLTTTPAVAFGPGMETEPEIAVGGNDATGGDLDAYLTVTLTKYAGNSVVTAKAGVATVIYTGIASGLQAAITVAATTAMTAESGDSSWVVYTLDWSVATGVDSIIQGDTATIGMTFTLTQNS